MRVADNYIDEQPAQPQKLRLLEQLWQDPNAKNTLASDIDLRVVANIREVITKYDCDPAWVDAFFAAMKSDISPSIYKTLDQSLGYVYGSAEVIGLVMARIMGLPVAANETAALQGRAMQWINFIRDIAEDNALQRCYFPQEDLQKFGLPDLSEKRMRIAHDQFREFMYFQIDRYRQWQQQANEGFAYIPRRYRIPLRTAADMYEWTAQQIEHNPLVVFDKKIKPSKQRVLRHAARRLLYA